MYVKGYELGTEYIGLRNYYYINAVIPSVAVFIFVKNINYSSLSSITTNIISKLSSYSFGVYLLHMFVMMFEQKLLKFISLDVWSWQYRILLIPVTYFLCLFIVYITKKTILGKWIFP